MANTTFDPSMLQSVVTVNVDADAYADAPPPPEGEYLVQLRGPKKEEDFYQVRMNKDERGVETSFSHVSFKLHGVIVDPDGKWNDTAVFPHVFATPSTKFSEKTQTTTALSLVKRLGFEHLITTSSLSHQDQIDILKQVIAAKPLCKVRTKWRLAGRKLADGSYEDDQLTGMTNFPEDPNTGEKQWQFPTDPVKPSGEKMAARCEITEWIGKP